MYLDALAVSALLVDVTFLLSSQVNFIGFVRSLSIC